MKKLIELELKKVIEDLVIGMWPTDFEMQNQARAFLNDENDINMLLDILENADLMSNLYIIVNVAFENMKKLKGKQLRIQHIQMKLQIVSETLLEFGGTIIINNDFDILFEILQEFLLRGNGKIVNPSR